MGIESDYDKYAEWTETTDVSPKTIEYYLIGMVGEFGEIYDLIKKMLRDDGGKMTPDRLIKIIDEFGDFEWYRARFLKKIGVTLAEILEWNQIKLNIRKKEGKLHGR